MRKLSVVLGLAGIIGIGVSQAKAELSATDRAFAVKAASGGLTEVQAGQLAEQKAQSAKVKEFGRRMVTDHTQANQELIQIAQKSGLQLATVPDQNHQASIQKLRSASGSRFDTMYAQNMVTDHQEDVADFRKEAQNGSDPAMKSFAQKYVPILEEHLKMAQSLGTAG